MQQSSADRLIGMIVTLAAGVAIIIIQTHLIKKRPWKWRDKDKKLQSEDEEEAEKRKKKDYGDPFFRCRWGKDGVEFQIVEHRGQCACGRFMFRLLAPAEIKALDCPAKVRYPHIFVPVNAFEPLSDLRLLTLFPSRAPSSPGAMVVQAFCTNCGVHIFRASDCAADTLVVNVDCLEPQFVRSLEVSYYEDLLVYPGAESAASARYHNCKPCSQEKTVGAAGRSRRRGGHKASALVATSAEQREKEWGDDQERSSRNGSKRSPVNVIVQAFRHIAGGGRRRKRSKHPKASDSMTAAVVAAAPSPVVLMNGCNGHPLPQTLTPTSSATADDGDDEGEEGREEEKEENSEFEEEEGEEEAIKTKEAGAWNRWAEACELSRVGGPVHSPSEYGGYSSTSPKGMMRTRQGAFLSFGPGRGVMSGQGWNHLRERALATQATSWDAAVNSFTPPSMYQLRYHLKRHIRGVEMSNNNYNNTPTRPFPTGDNDQDNNHHHENGYRHHHHHPQQVLEQKTPVLPPKQNGYMPASVNGKHHTEEDEEDEEDGVFAKMNGSSTPLSLEEGEGTTPLTFTMYPN